MLRLLVYFSSIILIFSCNSKPEVQDPQKAKELFAEGMKLLNERISIESSGRAKAMELNKKAIDKFSSSYHADTSFTDAVLFASECMMYQKDYEQCAYWTTKLINLDTSQQNIKFCSDRIEFCKQQIGQ